MARKRLSQSDKQAIAKDYVAGKPVEVIIAEHSVSVDTFYRLRRQDPVYQRFEEWFATEAVDRAARYLQRLVGKAVLTLNTVMSVDEHNVIEELSPDGKVLARRRKIDHKILDQKRQAANNVINHLTRLSTPRETQGDPYAALLGRLQSRLGPVVQSLPEPGDQGELGDTGEEETD